MTTEIKVEIDKLRQYKIFLATPMYGGQCAGMYTKSIADLSSVCTSYGIGIQFYFLFNESLITRARNYCCDEFLRSDCTHMIFIDSDIGFDPKDVLALLALSITNPAYDVIGGPYPKKCISWEKIKLAVDKGVADQDPKNLENFVGDFVFNPKNGQNAIPINEPLEVLELGTGFMMMTKDVLHRYAEFFPDLSYTPDHVRSENFDGTRDIHAFFDTIIDPDSRRYLSEDYMFCYNVQKMGGKVWLCPWMRLAHVGMYIFGGSLAHLASVGASATADVKQLSTGPKQKTKK